MKKIFTIMFLLSALCGFAQPTVNADIVPRPGDFIQFQDVVNPPFPGEAGENITWDFSDIEPIDTTFTVFFGAPDTTELFSSFPESNLVQILSEEGLTGIQYFKFDETVFEELGGGVQGLGTVVVTYSDPRTILSFPLTYNTTYSDTYQGIQDFIVLTYREGEANTIVDGYGTLELPGATFDNVLRLKTEGIEVDSQALGFGIVEKFITETTSYLWVTPGYRGVLCQYDISNATQVGIIEEPDTTLIDTLVLEPDTVFSFDPAAISSSVHDLERIPYAVAPNPFTSRVTVDFELQSPEKLLVMMTNAHGQLVFWRRIEGIPGHNQIVIRQPDLPPGVYALHIRGEGKYLTEQLMKLE